MKFVYPACFYPEGEKFTVIVPDLPGCVTCGDNLAEAIAMGTDAASGWILDELEDGKKPPEPSDISQIKADEFPNGFASMLVLDMDSYAAEENENVS